MASTTDQLLHSAGDCPVCSTAGILALLVSIVDQSMLFICPMCGVAWKSPEEAEAMDEIVSIAEAAPKGLRFPTEAEIHAAVEAGVSMRLIEFSIWEDDLSPHLTLT